MLHVRTGTRQFAFASLTFIDMRMELFCRVGNVIAMRFAPSCLRRGGPYNYAVWTDLIKMKPSAIATNEP